MPHPVRARLSGWGRTNPTVAEAVQVEPSAVAEIVKEAGPRGLLARGLGRSYGDAAQNGGGTVLTLHGGADGIVIDTARRLVRVGAGVSIDGLLRVIVPGGFFVPVTPGTRFVTVGGAIASDIHGKNHHVDGSIGNHIDALTMVLADGSTTTVGPHLRPELFWATVGGMGLTGVIIDATLRLLPIETSQMRVDTTRLADLDDVLATMSEGDDAFRYSVAWIDLIAKGRHLGRSVLSRADHAVRAELDARHAADPLGFRPRHLVTVPPLVPPSGMLTHPSVAAFNEFWYRKSPRRRIGELQGLATYFHPLDMVGSWNRLYGSRGMVQYQFVVPFGEEQAIRTVVERLSASGAASFLAVLKRFGTANSAPLSFPRAGWTLAVDLPVSCGLADLLHGLDRVVLDAGGRHYFAKDAHMTADGVRLGYPRLEEWKAVRDEVDPHRVWQSDLGRRLGLV